MAVRCNLHLNQHVTPKSCDTYKLLQQMSNFLCIDICSHWHLLAANKNVFWRLILAVKISACYMLSGGKLRRDI